MSNKKYIIHTHYRTTCSYFCIPNKLLVILVRELHAVTIDSCQNSSDMRALNSFCIRAAMHNSSLSIALYCLTLTHAYTCENLLHKQKHSCDLRFDCFIALQAHTYAHSYIYIHYHTYIYTYMYIYRMGLPPFDHLTAVALPGGWLIEAKSYRSIALCCDNSIMMRFFLAAATAA